MNLGFRQIFTVLAALISAINVPAQDIPVLPDDPAVLKGMMPNGMAYYLVSNPTVKGVADFALVQKTGRLTTEDSTGMKAVVTAREAISPIKRTDPYRYMARHNVAPGREGFVNVTDDATVFRFSDKKLNSASADSTLLVIMDIADRINNTEDDFIKKWYSPADQAIIVSGDIDAKSMAAKLHSMSYMMPSGESAARPEYVKSGNPPAFVQKPGDMSLAEVTATWTSKRVPREYMNTVQPEMFEMTLNTLGTAAVGRIRKLLKDMDVPVADVSYGHVCSSSYPYDDSFSINVFVARENARKALEAVAGVMSSINTAGVGLNEYVFAESAYIQELASEASVPVKSNREFVDRCMNSFLYNSSLSSSKERLTFHTSRDLPDTMRLRLFNGIVMALLDGDDNMTVESPEDSSFAANVFGSAWDAASSRPISFTDINMADTLAFPDAGPKVKLKSSKKEHVSGGSLWTFSNGFKVIYKKMKTDRMHYTLALNGGFGSMEGLEAGEGAFLTDYLRTCRVNGLEADDFLNILGREGIEMDFAVSMSNTMINGSLHDESMPLFLKSLLALANKRNMDGESFDYYERSEYLALDAARGSLYSRMTEIDNIMCPDYKYSPYKQKGKITGDFRDKAEKFFNDRFSNMNDGVLILVGNMDEERLKKILTAYVGGFRTTDAAVRRPAVRYQPVSGWSTYTVDGDTDNIDVAISARMPLTMENFIASDLAAMVLKRKLAGVLDDAGMHFTLTYVCKINPEERFNMFISVSEASEDGFPVGMKPKTPMEALNYLRYALSDLNMMEITDDDLNPYKESLKNSMAIEMNDPAYWVHAIALRYLDGKDFSTNYASKIDAVTPDKVKAVLALLDDGCKVEYVTIKRD